MERSLRSRAAVAIDGALQACCLGVLLVVPTYSDLAGRLPFEPPKAMFVYLLGAAAAAGCVARRLLGENDRRRTRHPLIAVSALWLLATVVATALARAPSISLLGDTVRQQGLILHAACFALLLAAAASLISDRRRRHAAVALLAGAIPIALLALLERTGAYSLVALSAFPGRSSGTLGNPLFLGAYLLFALAAAAALAVDGHARGRRSAWIAGGAATLLLAALLVSGSRGPVLAALTGTGVALLALGRRRARHLTAWLVAATVAVTLVIGVLGPEPIERLTSGLDPGSGTARMRIASWEAAAHMLADPETTGWRERGFGVGLEGIWPALGPYLSSERLRNTADEVPDRLHSEALDVLVQSGAVGLFSYLLVWIVALQIVLRHTARDHPGAALFPYVAAASCLAAAGAARWLDGSLRLLGPALVVGLLGALLLMLVVRRPSTAVRPVAAVVLGLLAAHLVQTGLSFEIVTTRSLFALLLGGIVAADRSPMERSDGRAAPRAALALAVVAPLAAVGVAGWLIPPPGAAIQSLPEALADARLAATDPVWLALSLLIVSLVLARARGAGEATAVASLPWLAAAPMLALAMSASEANVLAERGAVTRLVGDSAVAALLYDAAAESAPWVPEYRLESALAWRSAAYAVRGPEHGTRLETARERARAALRLRPLDPLHELVVAQLLVDSQAGAAEADRRVLAEALEHLRAAEELDPSAYDVAMARRGLEAWLERLDGER